MAFDLASAKPIASAADPMASPAAPSNPAFDLANSQPVNRDAEAAAMGAHYRDVFTAKPGELSPGQQLFRAGLQQAEAIGEGLNFLPLLATHGITKGINALAGSDVVPSPYDAIAEHKQRLGLNPETPLERYITAAEQGAAGAGGVAKTAGMAAESAASPLARRLAETLAAQPVLQTASGATAGVSSQAAKDSGLGWAGQLVAGLAGGILPGIGVGAANAVRNLATASKAPEIVTQRLADSGMTPAEAKDMISTGQTVAELSKPLADVTGAVVRRSPEAANAADRLIETRQGQRSAELVNRLEGDIARTPATALQADDVLQAMQQQAAPLYQKAYANAPPIQIPADLTRRTSLQNAYRVMQKMAVERGYRLPDINANAVQPIPPLSLEHADLLKRAMDDVLYTARQPESGIGKAQLDDMKATRHALVQAIDQQAGPDYAAARQAFAGPAEARDALELGLQANKMSAEEISRYLADPALTEMEKQAFRIGAANQAKARIAAASDSREPANLFASPNAQQSLGALSHDQPPFLPELIQRQRQQARFEQGLMGGSQTQPRAQADQLLSDNMTELPTKDGLIRSAIQALTDRAITGNQRTLSDLARMLLSTDSAQNADMLRELQLRMAFSGRQPMALQPELNTLNAVQLLPERQNSRLPTSPIGVTLLENMRQGR